MMSNIIKKAMVLSLEENDDYISCENDIAIWRLFTGIRDEKVGPAVCLQLQQQVREVARNLKPEDVG